MPNVTTICQSEMSSEARRGRRGGCSEANDLIEAGILPECWFVRLARAVVPPHGILLLFADASWQPSQEDMGRGGRSFQMGW